MPYGSHCIGVLNPLSSRYWTLELSTRLFQLIEDYDIDLNLNLFALVRANKIHFGVANEPAWFSIKFENSTINDLCVVEDPGRSSFTRSMLPVLYQDEWRKDGRDVSVAQEVLHWYSCDGTGPSLRFKFLGTVSVGCISWSEQRRQCRCKWCT